MSTTDTARESADRRNGQFGPQVRSELDPANAGLGAPEAPLPTWDAALAHAEALRARGVRVEIVKRRKTIEIYDANGKLHDAPDGTPALLIYSIPSDSLKHEWSCCHGELVRKSTIPTRRTSVNTNRTEPTKGTNVNTDHVDPADRFPILKHFSYSHLPYELACVSEGFHDLAYDLAGLHGLTGPEASTALRKLLEAKDAAVRAKIEKLRDAQ